MATRKLVLMTGASGMIGTDMRVLLRDRYRFRLMSHATPLTPVGDEEVIQGAVDNLDDMRRAVAGVDAVLHLAASSAVGTPWPDALRNNIVGVYNTYEAMREAGVKKVVFASTNHVTGMYERDGLPCYPDVPVRPDGYYGASKAFGEALGRYYSDEFGLQVICLRIGSYLPEPRNERNLATWLSPRDMAQLFWRSLEIDLPFGIFYAVSGNRRRYWSIESAVTVLGYRPEDDAELYAGRILKRQE
jgi:nucleoside-diphosphate-sugar epimerase